MSGTLDSIMGDECGTLHYSGKGPLIVTKNTEFLKTENQVTAPDPSLCVARSKNICSK